MRSPRLPLPAAGSAQIGRSALQRSNDHTNARPCAGRRRVAGVAIRTAWERLNRAKARQAVDPSVRERVRLGRQGGVGAAV